MKTNSFKQADVLDVFLRRSIITFVLTLIVCSLLIAHWFKIRADEEQLRKGRELAVATVVDQHPSFNRLASDYVTVVFSTPSGEYETRVLVDQSFEHKVGSKLAIRYDPISPSSEVITDADQNHSGLIIPTLIALGFLIVGFVYSLWWRQSLLSISKSQSFNTAKASLESEKGTWRVERWLVLQVDNKTFRLPLLPRENIELPDGAIVEVRGKLKNKGIVVPSYQGRPIWAVRWLKEVIYYG